MKDFEYAAPHDEADVLSLLSPDWGQTEILAGGTDLIGLMKKMIVTPRRVVNIKEVASLRGIQRTSAGVSIGATTRLDELLDSPDLDDYPAVKQAIRGIASLQLQQQGTIGGELCQRPRCWYFRNGHGLLGERGHAPAGGENRYHAIFGNAGPAKFVSPSRIAPALIALGAELRIAGPGPEDETRLPLEAFYRTPRDASQRENVLLPNQLVAQILLPPAAGVSSATYEVRHGEGPDYPLASAAAALAIDGGIVRDANIVLGQVAPVPWISAAASLAIIGRPVNHHTAEEAGDAAVADATPLSDNHYKVQLAKVAVKRAILLAAGLPTGGF